MAGTDNPSACSSDELNMCVHVSILMQAEDENLKDELSAFVIDGLAFLVVQLVLSLDVQTAKRG